MMRLFFPLLFMSLLMLACSPKTKQDPVETTQVEQEVEIPTAKAKKTSKAACITFDNLTPSEVSEARMAYSIYRNLVKVGDIDAAVPHWQKAFNMAPGANGQIKYHFSDGIKIYTHKYEQATTPAEKQIMLDSINFVFDKKIECYPEEKGYILGEKAYEYYYSFSDSVTEDKIFEMFKESLDTDKDKAAYFIISPMTEILYNKVIDKKISYDEGQEYAKLLLEAIEYGSANCEDSICEGWEEVQSYAPELLEALEGVDGFYDCEYYVNKYYPYYTLDPNNCEYISKAYGYMIRGNCNSNNNQYSEVKKAYDNQCVKSTVSTKPTVNKRSTKVSTNSVLKEAFQLYKSGSYKESVAKYDEYLKTVTDPIKAAKYNMKIARIYYRDIKNYPKSRQYALKASELRPNWGDPYLEIGKLYASSGKLCGPGRGFKSQVVTWPAIDMFKKAKAVDPSVTEEANMWIKRYSKFMPSKADIFQRSIEKGSTFRVECWIQRNTKVRTAD